MPDTQEMMKLAERLEQASGPDQELSNDILMATGIGSFDQDMTASIDAAMMLMPEGVGWTIGYGQVPGREEPELFAALQIGPDMTVSCGYATPALALAAASLRARANGGGE